MRRGAAGRTRDFPSLDMQTGIWTQFADSMDLNEKRADGENLQEGVLIKKIHPSIPLEVTLSLYRCLLVLLFQCLTSNKMQGMEGRRDRNLGNYPSRDTHVIFRPRPRTMGGQQGWPPQNSTSQSTVFLSYLTIYSAPGKVYQGPTVLFEDCVISTPFQSPHRSPILAG